MNTPDMFQRLRTRAPVNAMSRARFECRWPANGMAQKSAEFKLMGGELYVPIQALPAQV